MTLAGSYFKTSAWAISVPLLVYRLAELAWALWLAPQTQVPPESRGMLGQGATGRSAPPAGTLLAYL